MNFPEVCGKVVSWYTYSPVVPVSDLTAADLSHQIRLQVRWETRDPVWRILQMLLLCHPNMQQFEQLCRKAS